MGRGRNSNHFEERTLDVYERYRIKLDREGDLEWRNQQPTQRTCMFCGYTTFGSFASTQYDWDNHAQEHEHKLARTRARKARNRATGDARTTRVPMKDAA